MRKHSLEEQSTAEPKRVQHHFAQNMDKVMKYIDYGAHEDSIILGASNPIFPPHELILRAASAALFAGEDIYSGERESQQRDGNTLRYYSSRSGRGIRKLREALKTYCLAQGFPSDSEFMVTGSIQSGILASFFDKVLEEGDAVLLTTPTYGPFFSMLDRRKIKIKMTDLTADTNWKLTPAILEKMLSDSLEAKAFLFIHPGNPMGEVYSREELEAIAQVFVAHNEWRKQNGREPLIVFADEVAKNITFDKDKKFTSIGSIVGMEDFTLTAWSLSKDQSPGLGVAIGIGPKAIIEQVRNEDTGPAFAMQVGAVQMFELANKEAMDKHYAEASAIYVSNINLVQGLLENLDSTLRRQVRDIKPEQKLVGYDQAPDGGFQFVFNAKGLLGAKFPDNYMHIPNLEQRRIKSSLDLAWYLRETAKVEFIPGEGFGFEGEEMVFRMTIGKRPEQLQEAFNRVSDHLLILSMEPQFIFQIGESSNLNTNLIKSHGIS
ncbi:MAG: pyridoxal phosphate-dependent aminotransferase [Pseudomonadota bacterium]